MGRSGRTASVRVACTQWVSADASAGSVSRVSSSPVSTESGRGTGASTKVVPVTPSRPRSTSQLPLVCPASEKE